jgi:hypothetical protein
VKVANGVVVCCHALLAKAKWEVQGYEFHIDFNVLPLEHFDVILGYEWLEMFSPMRDHWSTKWMAIPYGQSTTVLRGVHSIL